MMEGFKEASVVRKDGQLTISWSGEGLHPVTIYQAETPDFDETTGSLLAAGVASPYSLKAPADVCCIFF